MGEFAFARSFGMLQDEKWHHAVIMLRKAMSLLGPLSPVPWLAQIGFSLGPHCWLVKDWYTMVGWCKRRMTERIEVRSADVCRCVDNLGHMLMQTRINTDGAREHRRLIPSHRRLEGNRHYRGRPALAER
jgi:hypothetical protein